MIENPDITLAVKSLLLANVELAEFVDSQVFVNRLPQSTAGRSILLWVVTETPFNHLGGALGLDQALIQFNSYGDNPADPRAIAYSIWKIFETGFNGVSEGVHIQGAARASGVRDATDRVRGGTAEYRFVAIQDMRFSYVSTAKVV